MALHLFQRKDPEEEARQQAESEALAAYQKGMTTIRDIIAPTDFIVTTNHLQLGTYYVRTVYVYEYPNTLETDWVSPLITTDLTMDMGMFITPLDKAQVMSSIRRTLTQLESTRSTEQDAGKVRDPEIELALTNIEQLRDELASGSNRLFQFGFYITLYAKSLDELNQVTKFVEGRLGEKLIYSRPALVQMEQGFTSTLPLGTDSLSVLNNLDTGSLSTTFPFTTAELTMDDGILYGENLSNGSLIIFDRYSSAVENANSVVFATSGAGKSFFVKLEIIRYLMLGASVIVIDPENEYERLTTALGGSYLEISLNADKRINPFDLPVSTHPEDGNDDALQSNITTLHGLIRLMGGGITPEEDNILDKALFETYALRDITSDPATHKNPPPVLGDLVSVLGSMRGAEQLVQRLEKYVTGSFAGLFNQPTNVELNEGLVVFSVRDLEESLRPIAIFVILNYIWTLVRSELKQRLMVVDEAWWMMQYEDSARFLYGLAKRARKYYLGLTVISQDVEDFLTNKYGKAVVSNSAIQVLFKQSTSSIETVSSVFKLTEQEKYYLLNARQGEGLFFAGPNHVAFKAMASEAEFQLVTTDPRQLLALAGEAYTGGGQ